MALRSTDQLPTITDDEMRTRVAKARPYTVLVLHTTAAFARPACDAVVWEHGRRNMALVDAGLLSVVLPIADDSGIAGYGVFDADLETTRRIMDDDPGVAGIFSVELHPVRGFPAPACRNGSSRAPDPSPVGLVRRGG